MSPWGKTTIITIIIIRSSGSIAWKSRMYQHAHNTL